MAYFKLNNTDFSMYVNALKVSENVNYNSQTNAAGDTVVDYINRKKQIEIGIIPLNSVAAAELLEIVRGFSVQVTFLNPNTNLLEEATCIVPSSSIDYYTIQAGNVKLNAFSLTFIEL